MADVRCVLIMLCARGVCQYSTLRPVRRLDSRPLALSSVRCSLTDPGLCPSSRASCVVVTGTPARSRIAAG